MKVQFYSKLPLTPNMQVRFNGRVAQENFFDNNHVISHDNVSIQIVDKNTMKIDGVVSNYQPINYMRFTSESKWYYAYVTGIEYVNNHTTLIRYAIDVIQTFLFDVTFLKSYILRQHTADDSEVNLINEPMIAPLIHKESFAVTPETATEKRAFLLIAKATSDAVLPEVNNYYIGTVPFIGYAKKCSTLEELKEEINSYTSIELAGFSLGTSDRIIAVYNVPSEMCKVGGSADYYSTSSIISKPENLDGYVPKNKKLYQYPFTKVVASNNRGNKQEFAFDGFEDGVASFNLYADVGINDSLVLVPTNYLGVVNDFNYAIENTNRLDIPFKQNNYTWDRLFNSLQSAGNSIAESAIESTENISGGEIPSDVPAASGITNIFSSVADIGQTVVLGYPSSNGVSNSDLLTALGLHPFRISTQTLRNDIARIYDEYFTRYGYAQNKLDDVNIYQHDGYCYIQTKELQIKGNIQKDYLDEFKMIFNSGITFFDSVGKVGNYE